MMLIMLNKVKKEIPESAPQPLLHQSVLHPCTMSLRDNQTLETLTGDENIVSLYLKNTQTHDHFPEF